MHDRWIGKRRRVRRLAHNLGFMTVVFTFGTLWINAATGVERLISACFLRSVWDAAVGVYYLVLCGARYLLFRYAATTDDTFYERIGTEAFCAADVRSARRSLYGVLRSGYSLIILTVSFLPLLYLTVFDGRSFDYPGVMLYAAGASAVYKTVFALINLRRAKKGGNILLGAIRQLNRADALVSLVALQTALLDAIPAEPTPLARFFNACSGTAAALLIMLMGKRTAKSARRELRALDLMERQIVSGQK